MDGRKVLGKVEMFEKPKSKKMEILGKIMDEMNLEILNMGKTHNNFFEKGCK
jgi:hypothetical protein